MALLPSPVALQRAPLAARHASRRRLVLAAGAWGSLLCAASCPVHAQYSAPREQTQLDITLSAAADVNPDDKGRAAPILIRLYELKSDGVFTSSDYFSLQSNDKALLGGDLLVRDEFILKPGEVKTLRRKSHPDTVALGVLAGYRDLAQADWRAVHKVEPAPEAAWYRMVVPANKLKLQIQLQAKGIRLVPTE
ncbi:type VI secretion system lipoprotein TssJ [uncultured Pseudacidovorax sp.]|uniref:type VI secretion system lipoprotein TssJ n=1 Tax=uncultured Pseudacidovorax sp. TaxID=679313 RepID=UPI0025D91863|nr:type VI secretion system lipoprotein TssJ [uncultured Pseudacidovorax sp.]